MATYDVKKRHGGQEAGYRVRRPFGDALTRKHEYEEAQNNCHMKRHKGLPEVVVCLAGDVERNRERCQFGSSLGGRVDVQLMRKSMHLELIHLTIPAHPEDLVKLLVNAKAIRVPPRSRGANRTIVGSAVAVAVENDRNAVQVEWKLTQIHCGCHLPIHEHHPFYSTIATTQHIAFKRLVGGTGPMGVSDSQIWPPEVVRKKKIIWPSHQSGIGPIEDYG